MTTSAPTTHHTTASWCTRRRANPKPSAATAPQRLTPVPTALAPALVLSYPRPPDPYTDPSPTPNPALDNCVNNQVHDDHADDQDGGLANGGDSGRQPLQCIKKRWPCPPPSPPPQPLPPPRPTKPPLNCTMPLDFVLVLDESGSMFSFMEGVGGLKHFAKELVRH